MTANTIKKKSVSITFLSYSKYLKSINILAVYGGTKIEKQITSLKRGPQIVIGTPGRTKDLI